MRLFFVLAAAYFLAPITPLSADTIRLRNGNEMEGFVENEWADSYEVDLGFGTVVLSKSEVAEIVRSDAAGSQKIWNEWGARKKEETERRPTDEKMLAERRAAEERLLAEVERRRSERDEYGVKEVVAETQNGHFYVTVLLNGRVRAKLILDSGASAMALPKRVADSLEMDFSRLKKDRVRLADGRIEETTVARLESVEVLSADPANPSDLRPTGIAARDVETFVLMRANDVIVETADRVYKPDDGLLGMSFLKYFQIKLDYENRKIYFEKNRGK